MELVYVIKGFNIKNEQRRWMVSASMVGECGSPEAQEAKMLEKAEELIEKLRSEGWYITNKEVGMLHDDRRGYDPMGTFGEPLNSLVEIPKSDAYKVTQNKVYSDQRK